MKAELRKLPSVDKLLQGDELSKYVELHSRQLVVEAIRLELEQIRDEVLAGQSVPPLSDISSAVQERVAIIIRPSLQAVINATGVIIHTNLGRAILSRRAQEAMIAAASAYSNLEYDLGKGRRGSRYIHAAELLCQLTGAEAAVVVNNNAGALILALTALAKGAEVIISRSQLIEIGGGFRIPDIMVQSGATLVEVGTTNRTYVRDYERAISPDRTALLLAVHHSNYQILGFTAQPTLQELSALSHRHHLPLMEDLGSGTLLDTTPFGLAHEPTIQESLAAGADIVTASGDKLLGGPQAGLILGRAEIIETLKHHPLIRAFRVDKITLAALQATLLAYLEEKAIEELPVWRMIAARPADLEQRVHHWVSILESIPNMVLKAVKSVSTVGGGSLPGQTLPTHALAISGDSVHQMAERLREADPPVIARVENDLLLLDPRTVLPEQDDQLLKIVKETLTV